MKLQEREAVAVNITTKDEEKISVTTCASANLSSRTDFIAFKIR